MNRRHAAVIGGLAIASISTVIFLYYFFMPAWVYVEVTRDANDSDIVTLTDEDIARHPILQLLVIRADESRLSAPSSAIVMIPTAQAIEIANLLEIGNPVLDHRGTFIHNGMTYYIHIFYQYDPPILL